MTTTLTVYRAVYGTHYSGGPAYGKAYRQTPKGTWDTTPRYTFMFDRDPGTGPMTLTNLGECKGALRIIGEHDGYLDDAEYLADVACEGCGLTRADAATCETCGVTDCCDVELRSYDCGDPNDGMRLCSEDTPSHRGCPECDPPDRGDR